MYAKTINEKRGHNNFTKIEVYMKKFGRMKGKGKMM